MSPHEQIHLARLSLHFTQAVAANKIGISLSHYKALESGVKHPGHDTLLKICKVLKTKIIYPND